MRTITILSTLSLSMVFACSPDDESSWDADEDADVLDKADEDVDAPEKADKDLDAHVNHPLTNYCKIVTAQTLSMFRYSTGYDVIRVLKTGLIFYATSSDNGRYHGYVKDPWNTTQWGYISASPSWTNPVTCP